MIDVLSTRRQASVRPVDSLILLTVRIRQTDLSCNMQIHSMILALRLHVVVLSMDLNGHDVIQKCLNKLAPEDNQVSLATVQANVIAE